MLKSRAIFIPIVTASLTSHIINACDSAPAAASSCSGPSVDFSRLRSNTRSWIWAYTRSNVLLKLVKLWSISSQHRTNSLTSCTLNNPQEQAALLRGWWSLEEEKQTYIPRHGSGRKNVAWVFVSGGIWCRRHALGPAMFRLSIGKALISWPFVYKELPTDVIEKLNTLGLIFSCSV